jgi:hypothetical protein
MAIENPNLIQGGTLGIEAEKTLNTSYQEHAWLIPPRIGVISISVKLDAETGMAYKVEYTNATVARVQSGTNVPWFDAFGASQSTSKVIALYGAISAIRITRTAGTMLASIRGQ